MRLALYLALTVSFGPGAGAAAAQTGPLPAFPMDTPQRMRAIEAVCTGVGADTRADPRWTRYPLRIEIVGPSGEYLGQAEVTLEKDGEALASINCGGPWLLFGIEPGVYTVAAEISGARKSARVNVGTAGQARLILRFDRAAAPKN